MSIEVVTYANKSSGMFEELVNNEHGVKVKVLGMGKKWNGFLDKYKGVLEYIETKKRRRYNCFFRWVRHKNK